jgi:putative endonuclease
LNPDAVTQREVVPFKGNLFFIITATVYILYSPTLQKFYVGFTTGNVAERLNKHLANHKGFTAKAKDWTIVHTEEYPDKPSAMQREREIKK